MNRLTYLQKFLLVSSFFIVPLVLALSLLISETGPRLEFTNRELAGSRYLRPLRSLLEHALAERDMFAAPARATPEAEANRQAIEADWQALQQIDQETGATLRTTERLGLLRERWQRLRDMDPATDPATVDSEYEQFIAELRQLMLVVGNQSNLILDPELTSYYLMDAVLLKLPAHAEELALVRARSQQLVGSPGRSEEPLVAALGLLRSNRENIESGLSEAIATKPELGPILREPLDQLLAASDTLLATVERDLVRAPSPTLNESSYQAAYQPAVAATFSLWDRTIVQLDQLLQARVTQLQQKNAAATGVALVLFVVVAYLLMSFYRSVMDTVQRLREASERLASGGDPGMVALGTRDELGQVVYSFNTVASALVRTSGERAAAEAERAQLQERMIQSQAVLLTELSAPLIPITDNVVIMPLIGTLDVARVQNMTETLLKGIGVRRVHLVIIDLTGVPAIDAGVANRLVRMAEATRMLGAETMLTGIRADVAKTLTGLGVTLDNLQVCGSLQEGIAHALSLEAQVVRHAF